MAEIKASDAATDATQQVQQLVVLGILLLVYVSIPVSASIFAVQQLFPFSGANGDGPYIDEHWFVSFLGTLSGSEKSILELVHKLVLPFAALFVGSNLTRLRQGWLANSLFLLPLAGVVAGLLAAVLFDTFATNTVRTHFPLLPTLFTDIASNLGIFTLLMIGINMDLGAKP